MVAAAPSRVEERLLEDLDGARWRARFGAAIALGVAWFAVHIGVAFVVTSLVAGTLGQPVGWLPSLAWFFALCIVATGTLQLTQQLGRRLIPLRTLLRLSLAFPGAAPSRYAIALRAGHPRFLSRRLRDTADRGIDEPHAAAVGVLELVAALSRHDRSLRGHSERVRAYSELVAEQLGLDSGARDGLRWAALMHDVGKLEIPAAVLDKAGPLNADEWELIRTHPRAGAELCKPFEPWLGEWASAVLDHHERWDGRGYPRGLNDAEISLAGRIVAVADAFDVMTSARSYKRPRTADDGLAELARCAGTQFDPNVVDAFLHIPVRRLRRVMGPWAVWAQRPYGWSWAKVIETAGGPVVAIGVASIVGLLAPVLSTPGPGRIHLAPRPDAPAGVADETHVLGTTITPPPQDASSPPGADAATSGAVAGPSAPTTGRLPILAPPAPPTVPPGAPAPPGDNDAPPDPGGAGGDGGDGDTTPPIPDATDDVAVTLDPSAGTISVGGVDTGPIGNEVAVPGSGDVTCGVAGACDPVTVTLPGGLP